MGNSCYGYYAYDCNDYYLIFNLIQDSKLIYVKKRKIMNNVISLGIKFISKNEVDAFSPVLTIDNLFIIALILLILFMIFCVFVLRKYKEFYLINDCGKNYKIKEFISQNKFLSFSCMGFCLVLIIAIIGIFTYNAFAEENQNYDNGVVYPSQINAVVDEETGDISIDKADINLSDKDICINKVSLNSDENLGDSIWLSKLNEECIYNDKINLTKDSHFILKRNTKNIIEFNVNNLNLDIAKSLIKKTAVYVNLFFNIQATTFSGAGKINVQQSLQQQANRKIEASNQIVYFQNDKGKIYTTTSDNEGNFMFDNLEDSTSGDIYSSIIGCKTYDDFGNILQNSKVHINNIDKEFKAKQNLNYEGPDFDCYNVDMLKQASSDLSINNNCSAYFKEFNNYINTDKIWWSNSNNQQDINCSSSNLSNINIDFCNQEYKCNFETEDNDLEKSAASVNQFMFLRVIGINEDVNADTGQSTGLTFQTISCVPKTYAYGPNNEEIVDGTWDPKKNEGRFWADSACDLRNNMNNGKIFSALPQAFKDNILNVEKFTQRKHKYGFTEIDKVKSIDKLFVLSYSEMTNNNSSYSAFKNYPWYVNSAEGNQYSWYKIHNVVGNGPNKCLSQLGKTNNGYQLFLGWNPWLRTTYYSNPHNFLYLDSDTGSLYKDNSYENEFSVNLAFSL